MAVPDAWRSQPSSTGCLRGAHLPASCASSSTRPGTCHRKCRQVRLNSRTRRGRADDPRLQKMTHTTQPSRSGLNASSGTSCTISSAAGGRQCRCWVCGCLRTRRMACCEVVSQLVTPHMQLLGTSSSIITAKHKSVCEQTSSPSVVGVATRGHRCGHRDRSCCACLRIQPAGRVARVCAARWSPCPTPRPPSFRYGVVAVLDAARRTMLARDTPRARVGPRFSLHIRDGVSQLPRVGLVGPRE